MSPLTPEWVPLLKKTFLFSSFSEDELAVVLEQMNRLSLPKGAVLFREGDPGDALYLILSGRVRIARSANGEEKTIAYLGRSECLGEAAILTGEPRLSTAHVDATVELLVLYRKDFEPLLRSMPSMAIHIARVLSHRLLEADREQDAAYPSKIYPLIGTVPRGDIVVFAVNLAVSLIQQTRRKVLLLDLTDQPEGVFIKSLGLTPVRVGESSLRQEDLQSPAVVQRLSVYHPSGLELMSLPLDLMEGKLYGSIYPFLSLLRQNYDITLLALPARTTPLTRSIVDESDRLLLLEREAGRAGDELDEFRSSDKTLPVRLVKDSSVGPYDSVFQIRWDDSLGESAFAQHTPFVLRDAQTHRQFDRLARKLGKMSVGLALGSGAAYGYALIGMLRVMERHGVYPDILSGTSIGALIGAFYAAGKSPDELEEIARGITKQKILSLADFTLPWQGVIIGREVHKFLKSVIGDVTFEELALPLTCVATDIVSGEEVVLKTGKVADAVRGSLSLPFFFQPYFLDGRFLVDGGLVNPVPSSAVAAMGADVLLSVNLTTRPGKKRMPGRRDWRRQSSAYWKGPNLLEIVFKTLSTMQFEVAQARADISHAVFEPDLSNYTWMEFHRAEDIIKAGEDYMEESILKIKTLLPFFADHCRMPLRPRPPAGY
ncbi:MAG TPA: patatin-like phospholipase family protein [Elusimicrobiota bacterium]|nr:patatin-like phospholipase family protein [Elusimicrobiota bacterium]